MKEIVKVCKIHGNLSIDNIKQSIERGKLIFRCKVCTNENAKQRAANYRKNNHDKLLEYRRKYRKIYQVNISFKFPYLSEFDLKECTYFLKKNNTVRIILKN